MFVVLVILTGICCALATLHATHLQEALPAKQRQRVDTLSARSRKLDSPSVPQDVAHVSHPEYTRHDMWKGIPMPKKSYFSGFAAPTDQNRWNHARIQAARGEHVLLRKVLQELKSMKDIFAMENSFKWTQQLADAHYTAKTGYLKGLDTFKVQDIPRSNAAPSSTQANVSHSQSNRAPIILLGNRHYASSNFGGHATGWDSLGVNDILKLKAQAGGKMPKLFNRKVVAMGLFDENWGWLSSYFLNRTITWGMSFGIHAGANPLLTPEFKNANLLIDELLEDENLLMLVVNSHNNFTHHKVISVPLGVLENSVPELWKTMIKADKFGKRKNPDMLLNTQGSNWAFRPAIRACVQKNMQETWKEDDIEINKGPSHHMKRKRMHLQSNAARKAANGFEKRVSRAEYRENMVSSYASLCLPGLGADTYKLWESFALGAMPVVERGVGLDRSLYRLPALLVDDFADIRPDMLRQAYIEALYRVDQWEYKRMTKQYWIDLVHNVSISNSIKPLLDLHPMHAVDVGFTRPMIPFTCPGGRLNGCGKGTKRTPRVSCGVDPRVLELGSKYDWFYKHVVLPDPETPPNTQG